MKKFAAVIIAALALTACTASQITTSIAAGLAGAQALLAILSSPGANGQAVIPVPIATQVEAYMTCATNGLSVASGIAGSGNTTAQDVNTIDQALGSCLLSPVILSQLPASATSYIAAVQAAVKAVMTAYGIAPASVAAHAVRANALAVGELPHPGMIDRMKIRGAGKKAATLSNQFAALYAKNALASR